jgi:YidC/Oxa1 family membrane protein insertase
VIGDVFRIGLADPMVNFLIILNNLCFNSFGLAIIAFTIVIKLVTFPLTLRQLHSTRSMQQLQPRVQEISKKYTDPKRRQEETMRAYREAGVNPLGCLGPMLLQFPIFIALFFAIQHVLPRSPEALEDLSGHLYSWGYIQNAVPMQTHFLGFDLRISPNEAGFVSVAGFLVLLVGLTTWAQTKTSVSTPSMDEKQRAQQQMMAYMMPVMFAFFALSFPAGVSIYWVVNSLVTIAMNIVTFGLPALHIKPLVNVRPKTAPQPDAVSLPAAGPPISARELRTANGPSRNKRQNRRRRP